MGTRQTRFWQWLILLQSELVDVNLAVVGWGPPLPSRGEHQCSGCAMCKWTGFFSTAVFNWKGKAWIVLCEVDWQNWLRRRWNFCQLLQSRSFRDMFVGALISQRMKQFATVALLLFSCVSLLGVAIPLWHVPLHFKLLVFCWRSHTCIVCSAA